VPSTASRLGSVAGDTMDPMRSYVTRPGDVSTATERSRHASFLLRAPTLVVVLGFAAAALVAFLGVAGLKAQSDEASALRSEVIARTLAARLRATALEDRPTVIERAARRSGAELLLVTQDGEVAVDGSLGAPSPSELVDMLIEGTGERATSLGRARYFVASLGGPLEHLSLIAFVEAPERPFATSSLLLSVAALTVILLGAAALVAFSFARAMHEDVAYVRKRIREMASSDTNPSGKAIPVRDADQLGLLTSAFNVLVERFTAAEHAYRQDLAGATESDRDRSAFLAALSHELRTPLNAILGFCDVLLAEVDGPLSEDARENLTVMRNSGEHLRSLIDDILDLSAMESGELSLDLKIVDVFDIAAEVVREARVTGLEKSLAVELSGGTVCARVDPLRVRQMISNLVSNAVKFTSRGRVTVDVSTNSGNAVVTVADTGPGIAADQQGAIFEEYRQAPAHEAAGKGTGLGLAITRRLVQMHRGHIELQSEVGRGAVFRVYLPIEAGEPGRQTGSTSGLRTAAGAEAEP
jgi:signal transduction histidine kinase